ncbi:MAG: HAD hydrolase-like protein [Actinobacteria bacterium]|nr:HAD hydrolase-like protein [Actinomycetota bacterium]
MSSPGDRWATFDCYGTLVDWETGIADALTGLWPDADRPRLLERFAGAEPGIEEDGTLPYREVLVRTTRMVASTEGLSLRAEDEGVVAASLPTWPVFPEVPDVLRALRSRGWSLAILSNTDPDLLAASIESIGVSIDRAVTAAEAGSYKPAHGHWEKFFELTGAQRDRHVHVAASLFHDIAPAAGEMGLRAVWINRKAEITNLPRDAELLDLEGLPEELDRLMPTRTPE